MEKNQYFLLTMVLTIFIFVSCKEKPGPDQEQGKKITIGMVTFPGYAPLYLAKEKGFFDDLDVELIRIESISDMRAAMNSGNLDIYASTYDIFQSNQGADVPGVGFMLIDESHGADGIISTQEIGSVADLKGKRLAAEPGLPPYFLLQYILDKEGLTMKDIILKDIATQDAGAAFVSGSVDAAALYEPFLSNTLTARKNSRILISSETEPGLLADLLFTSRKLLNEDKETLRKISQGWFNALDYIESHPEESFEFMGKAFGVTKQEMQDFKSVITWYSKEDNLKMFDKANSPNVYEIFQKEGDILERNGAAVKRFEPEEKITDEIISLFK